eukprot:6448211-Prymnesium_polylepis.1
MSIRSGARALWRCRNAEWSTGHCEIERRSIRNQFVAQIHVRFGAVSRLSRGCLALSRAVSR